MANNNNLKYIKRINVALPELRKSNLQRVLNYVDKLISKQRKDKQLFREKAKKGWKQRREMEENFGI